MEVENMPIEILKDYVRLNEFLKESGCYVVTLEKGKSEKYEVYVYENANVWQKLAIVWRLFKQIFKY